MAGRRDPQGAALAGKDRERLLRVLRLTASDRDGEALAALRRAAALMARLDLDWDAMMDGAGRQDLDAVAMAEAFEVGRQQGRMEGLREGRRTGVREGRAQERLGFAEARQASYAAGFAAGEAVGREAALSQAAEMVRAVLEGRAAEGRGERPDDEAADDVVRRGETIVELLGRPRPRSSTRTRHRAQIRAILDNPHTPARTVSFVASLSRWLDTRGSLTPGQADALEHTHEDWGRGAA